MLGRVAIYVIPSAAVVTAAFFLLGPGARHAVIGVRVRGVPLEGGDRVAFRLEGVRRLYGVDDAADIAGLRVEASSGGDELAPWEGGTGRDGIAEAILRAPRGLKSPVEVRVTRGGEVLAAGRIALRNATTSFQLATIPGTATGDLRIRVDVSRGALAAQFADPIRVDVTTADGGLPPAGIAITLDAPGAEIASPHTTADRRGGATVSVRPMAHDVELTVTASDDRQRTGRWEGRLPIVPGAIWLDPARFAAERRLALVSPAPRERAYVSVLGEHGRVYGAVVPLVRDAAGFFSGEATPALPPTERFLYAVVAGDPLEMGSGTVAWPLVPAEGAVSPRTLELVVDGLPAAEARETDRAGRARRKGALILALAAALEILLLLGRSRASQRRLEQHLAGAIAADPTMAAADIEQLQASARENPRVRTLAFVALVALAFAIVAAVLTVR